MGWFFCYHNLVLCTSVAGTCLSMLFSKQQLTIVKIWQFLIQNRYGNFTRPFGWVNLKPWGMKLDESSGVMPFCLINSTLICDELLNKLICNNICDDRRYCKLHYQNRTDWFSEQWQFCHEWTHFKCNSWTMQWNQWLIVWKDVVTTCTKVELSF